MKNPGIYVLTSPTGKQYVGRDSNLPRRVREHLRGDTPDCPAIHKAIQKYGRDAFSVEIIQYPGISEEALKAVERWWIQRLQTLSPSGYNLTEGGDGVIPSEETRQKMSEAAFQRVVDGTHPFLGGEISRRNVSKQLKNGTHPFLGENNPVHKRVADGTHNFLGGEIQRKRAKDGTHHFLGGKIQRETQRKRVADGTHPFLNGKLQRQVQKKRIDEGTHNFLGENHPAKKRTRKRLKAEWCYIIALSRFWYEIHDYTLKRRAEFLSKEIPDLSNAEQTYLF